MTTANGPAFWDSLLGPTGGQYPEYVSTDIFFGEYVALLEQDNTSESNGKASTPEKASSPSDDSAPPQKLPRWKRRTPEQIEANKAAQKRFRERKKAKLQSQSKDVEDLTQQMQDFEGLNAGVKAMETRKAALEQDLWSKEAEIERIKLEMLNPRTPQAKYDDKAQAKCFTGVFSTPLPLDKKIEKVDERWRREKQTLDRLLAETKAEPKESQAVPKKQLQGLEKQCLAVMGQCMEIMTLGGPQLEDLLRTAQDREEDLMRQGTIRKYAEMAQYLQLSGSQQSSILTLRESVLRRLERIYAERQTLNMQVMALLMSAQQTAPSAGSEGSSGNTFKLREKLNELLANLRKEQRLESEHHHAIFREILSPLQGAWFIVKAYPAHCDTLAFMHGVNELQKSQSASSQQVPAIQQNLIVA